MPKPFSNLIPRALNGGGGAIASLHNLYEVGRQLGKATGFDDLNLTIKASRHGLPPHRTALFRALVADEGVLRPLGH